MQQEEFSAIVSQLVKDMVKRIVSTYQDGMETCLYDDELICWDVEIDECMFPIARLALADVGFDCWETDPCADMPEWAMVICVQPKLCKKVELDGKYFLSVFMFGQWHNIPQDKGNNIKIIAEE